MTKKLIGMGFGIATAVLALVALFFYRGIAQSTTQVVVLLAIAIVVEVVDIITTGKLPDLLRDCFPIAKTVLIAAALVSSFIPQVNQIAYVVSGLDPITILYGFITAASIMGAAMLTSLVTCFIET